MHNFIARSAVLLTATLLFGCVDDSDQDVASDINLNTYSSCRITSSGSIGQDRNVDLAQCFSIDDTENSRIALDSCKWAVQSYFDNRYGDYAFPNSIQYEVSAANCY